MKTKTIYRCTNCGHTAPKWMGRCTSCGEWETFVEEVQERGNKGKSRRNGGTALQDGGLLVAAYRLPGGVAATRAGLPLRRP